MTAPSSKKKSQDRKREGRPKFNKDSKRSFKSKKDSSDIVPSEALALQLEDDVPDFPRGSWTLMS